MHPNQPIILLGSGGHAKVVADVLLDAGSEIAGCVCPAGSHAMPDIPWLGDDDAMPELAHRGFRSVHIAIGSNSLRRKLALLARDAGLELAAVISPRAIVSRRAEIGAGAVIMPGAVINTHTYIGECAIINTGATVDHDCRIGAYAHIAPGCHLAGSVSVGEGTFLGTGAVVIPEIKIGEWVIAGAGSVIVRDLPASVTAVGVPARITKQP